MHIWMARLKNFHMLTREDIGRTVDFASGRNRYIGYLISIPCRDFKISKVGLDAPNGSSLRTQKSVFLTLCVQKNLTSLNNDPDGTNINRACGSTHIEVLQKYVVDNGLILVCI